MRIVHEVVFPMTPAVGMKDGGARLELFATTAHPAAHPEIKIPSGAWDDEVIEIEGDPTYLIPLLESWLSQARRVLELSKAPLEEMNANPNPAR